MCNINQLKCKTPITASKSKTKKANNVCHINYIVFQHHNVAGYRTHCASVYTSSWKKTKNNKKHKHTDIHSPAPSDTPTQ